jgi:hypothetical protein
VRQNVVVTSEPKLIFELKRGFDADVEESGEVFLAVCATPFDDVEWNRFRGSSYLPAKRSIARSRKRFYRMVDGQCQAMGFPPHPEAVVVLHA